MSDKLKINSLWQFDIIDLQTGAVEHTQTAKNVITNAGLDLIAALVTGNNNSKYFSHCQIGTGTTLQTRADTALVSPVGTKQAITDSSAYAGNARIITRFTHTADQDITEAGLFDGSGANAKLLARVTTRSPAQLRNNKALNITISMSFS